MLQSTALVGLAMHSSLGQLNPEERLHPVDRNSWTQMDGSTQ